MRLTLVFASVALAFVSQYLISQGSFRWAIAPLILAAGSMGIASRAASFYHFHKSDPLSKVVPNVNDFIGKAKPGLHPKSLQSKRVVVILLVLLILLSVSVCLVGFRADPPHALAWYSYGAAVLILIAALSVFGPGWNGFIEGVRKGTAFSIYHRSLVPLALLGLILLFAFGLRAYQLDTLPAGLWYDEADNLLHAIQIGREVDAAPVFVPSTNLPSMFLIPIAVVLDLFGETWIAGRIVAVGFSLVGIAAVYFVSRLIVGPYMALISALLLAVMRWDINWSRIGMHGITAPVFATLTSLLTLRAVSRGRTVDFGWAGFIMGASMWFYSSLRLFPLVIGFILIHHLVVNKPGAGRFIRQCAVFVGVATIVAAPVAQYAFAEPGEFFARARATSVFMHVEAKDLLSIVGENFTQHALMFNYQGDANPRHNLPHTPMLDFVSGTLFVLGMFLALFHRRNTAVLVLPVWVFLMLWPGILTVPWESPQSLRTLLVTPAVAILITLVLTVCYQCGRESTSRPIKTLTFIGIATLLIVIAILNLKTYFWDQANHPDVYSAFSTSETLVARDMMEQQRKGYSLFASRQFLFNITIGLLGHQPYYEPVKLLRDIPLVESRVWKGAAIYLEPRDAGTLEVLKAYYPSGNFSEIRPPGGGAILYYSAIIDREEIGEVQGMVAEYLDQDGRTYHLTSPSLEVAWDSLGSRLKRPSSFSWKGSLLVTDPGTYVLKVEGDTEVVVLLDSMEILHPNKNEVELNPAIGLHALQVNGTVTESARTLSVKWSRSGKYSETIGINNLFHSPVSSYGLTGYFFSGDVAEGDPDTIHITPYLDVFYYDPVVAGLYKAVWEGRLTVRQPGQHRYRLNGVGEIILSINGRVIARQPSEGEIGPIGSEILEPGIANFRIEYSSGQRPPEFEVLWSMPGQEFQPIQMELLTPYPGSTFR